MRLSDRNEQIQSKTWLKHSREMPYSKGVFSEMKSKIAVLTSGGDAPGLNACVRAVVRTAVFFGFEVVGIHEGYKGMISGDFIPMDTSSVSNIIHLGGTILKSSRSDQFKTKEGRLVAYQKLQKANINNLIIIGGDGSFRGAKVFSDEHEDLNIIGIPKTIDNDISGTEYCIGYDTAINTAMKAIDKIRDTAESQNEVYIVEVMGRDAGYLAFSTGIVTGAEGILIPETSADYGYLKESFIKGWNRKKSSLIIVVAEGDERGKAIEIADGLKKYLQGREVRIVVLGHIQRGGSPTAFDRLLAARLGYSAVNALIENKKNMMVGFIKNEIHYTPLADICQIKMKVDNETLKFLKVLTS